MSGFYPFAKPQIPFALTMGFTSYKSHTKEIKRCKKKKKKRVKSLSNENHFHDVNAQNRKIRSTEIDIGKAGEIASSFTADTQNYLILFPDLCLTLFPPHFFFSSRMTTTGRNGWIQNFFMLKLLPYISSLTPTFSF